MFLEQVIKEKEEELEAKKKARSMEALEEAAAGMASRSFKEALRGGEKIIAEIKGKSPTVDAFLQGGNPVALAGIYETNGAAAISIVTDELNFGTSLRDVEQVRASVSLPILVKDFVIDAYQIVEARASGADCILLIARILTVHALESLLEVARGKGLDVLTECHDEEDIDKARAAGAEIIGINNRDLKSLEVNLEATGRLISRVPEHALCVSESGIDQRNQIEELKDMGVDAFLIGGALLGSEDPGATLRALLDLPAGSTGGNA